jgi:hypothetical protein
MAAPSLDLSQYYTSGILECDWPQYFREFILQKKSSINVWQNHWVSGLCPPSGILNTRKQNVSETIDPVTEVLKLALSKGLNIVGLLLSHEDWNRSTFLNVVFSCTHLEFRMEKVLNPVLLGT